MHLTPLRFLILGILFHIGFTTAHAEGGCPPGQYPQSGQGWQTCVPMPDTNSQGASSTPRARWVSQWQAIATDAQAGALGKSLGQSTSDDAERMAILDCKENRGTNCVVQISMANGCVAMVVGEKLMNTKGAKTKAEAESRAVAKCEEEDTNCSVYYSACSLPIGI